LATISFSGSFTFFATSPSPAERSESSSDVIVPAWPISPSSATSTISIGNSDITP
jgi:hypothetical protein